MCLIVGLGHTNLVSNAKIPLCTFAKPFVWHRDENASVLHRGVRQPVETETEDEGRQLLKYVEDHRSRAEGRHMPLALS